jgi:2'-5' RNA ligase superfamily
MPYALELALDDQSAAVVRALWRRAADVGFPFMAESGANPHVSIAIWDEIDRSAMAEAIGRFAGATPVVDVVFPTMGSFPTTGVVFLALAENPRLLDVHARCHRALPALGRGAWPHYAPGVWIPHCTLAMDLGDAVERIHAMLQPAPLPLRGRLERAELVEFRPVRHLMAAPLGSR